MSIWVSILLDPLKTEASESQKDSFRSIIKKQHGKKCQAWREFIRTKIPRETTNRFAIVEIGQSRRKGVRPDQNIYGAVREACALEKISSQMLQTVKPKINSKESDDENSSYSKKTKRRVLQAVLDVTLRQIGVLYGSPVDVYTKAGLSSEISQSLDIISLCRIQNKSKDVHYAIAVRLCATGSVDVMLPSNQTWIPYYQAGFAIGRIFSEARGDYLKNGKYRTNSKIKLKSAQLAEFAARITTQVLERPTIILIEAEGWRNERGQDDEDSRVWPQLKTEYLQEKHDVLDFLHVVNHNCKYRRDDAMLENLLAVFRLRSGTETPQYIPDRDVWDEDNTPRNFTQLSGFLDDTVPELPHYFSVGRLPNTQKTQDKKENRELYKLDNNLDENGATIAFKHQQIVEMVPFFVHPDFQTNEGILSLCRCPHYLRTSPA